MNTIKIGVPTLSRYDLLLRFCRNFSLEQNPCLVPEITILDNGGKFLRSEECQALAAISNAPPISVVTPKHNLGVAGSWNYFAQKLGRCVISNDDVEVSTKGLKCFVDAANENNDAIIIENDHHNEGFSTFFLNKPEEWMAMGGFDECFYPAYFEDNDTRYRLLLARKPAVKAKIIDWRHDNSSTLHGSSDDYQRNHWGSFYRNQLYYHKKWGGHPGREMFISPFNAL